jgi:hypothetical protein
LAERVWLYATPTIPFGSPEGEIVITAGGAAWITSAYATLVEFGVALLSVAVIVNK